MLYIKSETKIYVQWKPIHKENGKGTPNGKRSKKMKCKRTVEDKFV